MKKSITLLIMAICLMSCHQNIHQAAGTYSYKLTGEVQVDTSLVRLPNEIGTLDLIPLHDSTLLITMNVLSDGVYQTEAVLSGKHIVLAPMKRLMELKVSTLRNDLFDVNISGEGDVYDGQLVLELSYSGISRNSKDKLKGDHILLIGKK